MRRLAALLLVAISASVARGQVVRGVVTERVSGAPLTGVLIEIANIPDSLREGGIRRTLTDARGQFAVRLPAGGRFVLSAKRIGVARQSTTPFALGVGESRNVSLQLDAFEFKLPTVNVVETNLCFRKPAQQRQILGLWDEVRTALLAAEVTRDEQRLTGWLTKYVRNLEPISLRILDDRRSVAEGLFERPMRSIDGDSLAKVGYWYKQDEDTLAFHAPDEQALLSPGFRAGYCFELVPGNDDQKGMIGLTFRPRSSKPMGGIEGAIWIDAGNFELRFIDFRYTNLITMPPNPHIGGQVHYLRHESGGWLVRRWFIRMPLFPTVTSLASIRFGVHARQTPSVYRLVEEGGGLFTPGLRGWETPGTIEGVMTDSTGLAPLRNTVVSLSGTPFSTEVDSLGRFRFDSIPPGAYTLLASHSAYADLGTLADDEPLTLSAGQTYVTRLTALTTAKIAETLCVAQKVEQPSTVLRILAVHYDSGGVLAGIPIWLRWADSTTRDPLDWTQPRSVYNFDMKPAEVGMRFSGLESITDADGAAVFCGIPPDKKLELVLLRSDDSPDNLYGARVTRVTTFIVRPGEVTSRTVRIRPHER